MHANSSFRCSRWRLKHSLLMHYTVLLLRYFFYLIRKCCLPEFQIFFSVCQNSLQGTSQKLLIEVLGCPHQGWKRHGHLHFHSGKVLQQSNCCCISTSWRSCNGGCCTTPVVWSPHPPDRHPTQKQTTQVSWKGLSQSSD